MTSILSRLTLVNPSPAQETEWWTRSYEAFGSGFGRDLDQWFERWNSMCHTRQHTSEGRHKLWVLVDANDTRSTDFFSQCMTYRRTGFVARAGKLEEAVAYVVSGVVTPKRNRGQGYAQHMISLLNWIIHPQPAPNYPNNWHPVQEDLRQPAAVFSALWTYVGDFYSRCGPVPGVKGWTLDDRRMATWDTSKIEATDLPSLDDWSLLDDAGVTSLSEKDAERIKDTMVSQSLQDFDMTFVALSPAGGVMSSQHWRYLVPPNQVDASFRWGVVSKHDPLTYATWTISEPISEMTLRVTRVALGSDEQFAPLIKAILTFAKNREINIVEIWNIARHLEEEVPTILSGRTDEENTGPPAFRWFGDDKERVQWVFNERYCWG
ncbi:hypothetical protein DL96DRAFT_1599631 [Flagelloscypha sp. PMI_526]|nr:hypothetical protein DL96DRAFT_1599631 [Flagelloscypha sp. PMI_526]